MAFSGLITSRSASSGLGCCPEIYAHVLIAALLVLGAIFFAVGVWAHFRALRYLAPGVTPTDVAWNPGHRDPEGWERLAALYTPRGIHLRELGMLSAALSALAFGLALIEAVL